jgi:uncharacterized protein (DUF58 family)
VHITVVRDTLRRLQGARRRAASWLTLDGRLAVAQPWALAPGPALLLLALVAPYRWLFFAAYCFLLLALAAYLWARALGRGVTLGRRLESAWAQVGDDLAEEWELENRARVPLVWLEIDDASTLPGYAGRRTGGGGW